MQNSNNIDRRTLVMYLAKGGLALGLMPGFAEAAWGAVAAGVEAPSAPPARALSAAQTAMVAVIADTILPRSDTPSATDVNVVAWIDEIVAGYFSDARRAQFLADLTAMEGMGISDLDAACGSKDQSAAQRGYAQLKELVVYGYFTSRRVQQDILKVVVIPGRFDGDVPMTQASAS